jgi:hypothetical protein
MKKEKKIDENLYNEKSLYLLNIKELRDLGRKIGVPAPATLKKQDLVDYILKIVYGEVDTPKRSSFGRPNVREVDMEHYLEKIRKKTDVYDEVLGASLEDFSGIFKVASHDDSSLTNDVEQRFFVEADGKFYFRKYAFVESESDTEVSLEIKDKFNLEENDIVEVIISGKSFKIISINGKIINSNDKKNEILGKKQVFHFCTKEEINKDILKVLNENKDLKTLVYSSENYKDNCDVFVKTETSDDSQKAFKHIMNFVNLCEKYIFEGETIVVLTDELDYIESVVDSLDEEVSNRTKKHLQTRINELLALGNALIVYKLDTNFIYQ